MAVSMDRVIPHPASHMPPLARLPMAPQDFSKSPCHQADLAKATRADVIWRVAAFAPAVLITLFLSTAIAQWFADGGVSALEAVVVGLVAVTFLWVSLPVTTVSLGLIRRLTNPCRTKLSPTRGGAQTVALLVPIYNEIPWDVFGNASAMLKELSQGPQKDRFSLFILSDTRDPEIAEQELRAFFALRADAPSGISVHYRRRAANTDKKVGNLTDWIENWGAGFDAMIVLDADSLMSGAAIRQLAHELAADPGAGLIQSFPSLIGSETLFGRMQQFSNSVYGWLLAEGLAVWSQRESNYWGHNAIIRTRAFADSARLPYLRGLRGQKNLILSHDFVEAGMLRRAGWGVRFLPRSGGSYEEAPQTVIDYAMRDRRWCQGNMQHLRILAARGFHPVSRFHLLQGAVGFLLSPAWFALIVIWALLGTMPEDSANYFSASNPLHPIWPTTDRINGLVYLAVIYSMLLLPKITATLALGMRRRTREDYGGWMPFIGSAVFEILCSILYAPVMMVQQTMAVIFAFLGRSGTWVPQNRNSGGYSWLQTLRFHWLETLCGITMTAGIAMGAVSLWLVPIAVSLILAVPLSKLSAVRIGARVPQPFRLDTPQSLREPRVVRSARAERAWMKDVVTRRADDSAAIAAE
ncbi:glucans biosynthesis glucosyltransferase MdoH [Marivita sp. S6314]|uniref:glucans biosynthesis glucosyltransferase MdoH n=1 Tax=Marivita sp. S6314 TaxID=2926406 RepID=UPI001FF3791B|nr:glucans biosynthesis glucosyltransferase MdoH [Marivita sp. S6314]MCK0150349.1 glucans biosynthesis glucosyltransferase MdoH [Marivita sp. S6314]